MRERFPEQSNTAGGTEQRPHATIYVKMFGDFTFSCGEVSVSNAKSRSFKVWLLLAYLLCNRKRAVPREELIRLLGERENNAGGGSALRMVRLRARRLLEPLQDMTGAELVLVREGSIIWNPDVPTEVDAEQLEALCRRAAEEKNKNKLVDLYCKALSLYDASFLEKLSAEPWVRPLTAYYQGMYLTTLEEAMPLLLEAGRLEEINRFGQVAVKISPYEEILYAFQMRALIAAGNYAAAEEIYRNVYQLLSNDLGVTPSEDLQELHMEALRHMDETVISEDLLLQSLREQRDSSGAMVCDFSTFRLFYQAEVRSASRRGDAVHLGLFSVEGKNGAVLRKPVLSRAMDQLRQQLHQTLRSGDIVASCSASQYVALLVQANFEDSQMVCQRVIRAFEKAYPRSQAEIRSGVIPLETHLDRM